MSKPKIIIEQSGDEFGCADDEFISKIDDRYTKRKVAILTGDNSGDVFMTPLVKRNDEETYDNYRLTMMMGYLMGVVDWDIGELDCGPLLGLHDHKGILTSFWDGPINLDYVSAIHKAWGVWYEHNHYAVSYAGKNHLESETFEVKYERLYETAD